MYSAWVCLSANFFPHSPTSLVFRSFLARAHDISTAFSLFSLLVCLVPRIYTQSIAHPTTLTALVVAALHCLSALFFRLDFFIFVVDMGGFLLGSSRFVCFLNFTPGLASVLQMPTSISTQQQLLAHFTRVSRHRPDACIDVVSISSPCAYSYSLCVCAVLRTMFCRVFSFPPPTSPMRCRSRCIRRLR